MTDTIRVYCSISCVCRLCLTIDAAVYNYALDDCVEASRVLVRFKREEKQDR